MPPLKELKKITGKEHSIVGKFIINEGKIFTDKEIILKEVDSKCNLLKRQHIIFHEDIMHIFNILNNLDTNITDLRYKAKLRTFDATKCGYLFKNVKEVEQEESEF
uniref:Uncharacterized protein n=1 Tax=Meloidogyne enterolobii TaxID=390850 RepID=A0A6V7XQA9_MELEN|nr:unnamed protein product [Meloidogyne enterolobii]